MIFHENPLLADDSHAGRRFSWNIIPYFCRKLGKMMQNLLSAAVVIGSLRINSLLLLMFVSFESMCPINNLLIM